ncbi:sensor histidine kinase [Sphingomonas sp. AX6]|uniref:sensor histidine kinase n=1 Tax=Sphingomonas sp. AX6 TaxID=2653171 RepID=UPI0012F462E3|nr:stimulus-sensing domain-containing protein [Sphingomonas sp. AX6]VXC95065.1 Sensor histidine kinase [Sphingomonas sp. AX6]
MAPDIDSTTNDDRDLSLRWSGRVSLTARILAVNALALGLVAGGFFYLDTYRARIVDNRLALASAEAQLISQAIMAAPPPEREGLVMRLARITDKRIRLYNADGTTISDSLALGVRNFQLRDPDKEPWQQDFARGLDAAIDTIVANPRDPLFRERGPDDGLRWPDVVTASSARAATASVWRAPDRTPVLTAAAPLGNRGNTILTTDNAVDITETVRVERFRLAIVLLIAALLSMLLSLFLARTIVRPLRHLARAAIRVRLGRAREVVVPRLPDRRDEIGMLARALSDMSQALRARIDATEAFAADVTHELKNPLASLRSAVEGLERIDDPALRAQLIAVIHDDVLRLDRLITDISDASRLDAQLSRAQFETVDMAEMIGALVDGYRQRHVGGDVALELGTVPHEPAIVLGEGARLERVFENLIANAVSFSPPGGQVTVAVIDLYDWIEVVVDDEGPGVAEDAREAIFRRFHSDRPDDEAFGKHSGLGLAIARTIVEAHQGKITVESHANGAVGARFVVRLPKAIERRSEGR